MRVLLTLSCLCLLQACNFTQSSSQMVAPLFPFEQNMQADYNPYLSLNNKVVTKPVFTKKAEESFIYLALDEAIRNDDYEKVMESSEALLRLSLHSQSLAGAASWLLSNGHLKETRKLLENAAKKMPNDLDIHVMLAEAILIQDDDNEAAIKVLKTYASQNPKKYIAQMELALIYLKTDDAQNAYTTFDKLPESEKTPMVLYYTGFSLRKLGRLDEAVKALKKALKGMPEFMEVVLELAQIEEERKNYRAARKYYERVLSFDAYNQDIQLRLVGIALKEGNPDKALELAQKSSDSFSFTVGASSMLMEEGRADLVEILLSNMAKQDNPPRELLYLQGALAYEGSKNYAKSLGFLKQITPQDKHYKNSLSLRTQIYLEQEKLQEAVNTLQEAQRNFKDDMTFVTMEYQIYLYQGAYAKALPLLEMYLKTNPKDSDAAFKYAFVHVNLGMEEKAFKLMEDLLENDPENHEVLNFIGYTLIERKRDMKYALGLLEKANSISPDTDYITDSLAWAYYQMENYSQAWIYIQKAISLIKPNTSEDPAMWDHYGDIAFSLGNSTDAKTGWERSIKIKANPTVKSKLEKLTK